jgi:hypothetical protein
VKSRYSFVTCHFRPNLSHLCYPFFSSPHHFLPTFSHLPCPAFSSHLPLFVTSDASRCHDTSRYTWWQTLDLLTIVTWWHHPISYFLPQWYLLSNDNPYSMTLLNQYHFSLPDTSDSMTLLTQWHPWLSDTLTLTIDVKFWLLNTSNFRHPWLDTTADQADTPDSMTPVAPWYSWLNGTSKVLTPLTQWHPYLMTPLTHW